MNRTPIFLTAALGLVLNALLSTHVQAQVAQANSATTKITALPFSIVTPGTYKLVGNLSFPSVVGTAAINILGGLPGPVVLDLQGFTISGDVTPGSFCIVVGASPVSSPVTVKDGTIQNFAYGVYANNLNNLTINKVTFLINILRPFAPSSPTGILFQNVNSSTISNCVFTNSTVGIQDINTGGGNRYVNDSFVSNATPLEISLSNEEPSFLVKDCEFAPPPSN